jgi:hypothetical protein
MQAQKGSRGIILFTHNFVSRYRWVVNNNPYSFSPGKSPGTHYSGGWVGSNDGLEGYGEEKNSCSHWGSNLDLPAHSESLYGLLYPSPNIFMYFGQIVGVDYVGIIIFHFVLHINKNL